MAQPKTQATDVSLPALRRATVEKGTLAACLSLENERSIYNYAKRGLLVKAGHGKYLLVESIQNVTRELHKQAAGRIGKDENVDAARSNAQLKDAQRQLVELRLNQLSGALISTADIDAAWAEIALNVKQMFLALPARARFLMPHLSGEDQDALDGLVRDMLSEVAFCVDPPRLPSDAPLSSDEVQDIASDD